MGEVVSVVPLSSLGVDSLPAAVKREVGHELSVASSLMRDLLVSSGIGLFSPRPCRLSCGAFFRAL